MRRGRLLIAAVAVVLLGLVFAGSALACSCVRSDPAESLAESDGAVVARLLEVERTPSAAPGTGAARFEYRILHAYRGKRLKAGGTLTLQSPLSGAACGLPAGVGRHYGLFLRRGEGRWRSSRCSVVSPPEMRSAARAAAGSSSATGNRCAG